MAVKRQLVASQPACLCLHVQRATLTASGRTAKNSSGVTFGRKLSFRPWISNRSSPREASSRGDESSECVYVLKAVVLHFGGDSSGHFVAYRCLSPYPESRPIVGSSADSGTLTQNWHLHINTIGLASSQPDTPSDTPDCPCATEASRAQLRPAAETCHSDPQESESADSGSGRAHNTCDSPRWYRLSDERVTSVGGDWMKELEKYSSNVYILFYERVGDGA